MKSIEPSLTSGKLLLCFSMVLLLTVGCGGGEVDLSMNDTSVNPADTGDENMNTSPPTPPSDSMMEANSMMEAGNDNSEPSTAGEARPTDTPDEPPPPAEEGFRNETVCDDEATHDRSLFSEQVAPSVIQDCGNSACHGPGSNTNFAMHIDAFDFDGTLSDDDIDLLITEFEEFLVYGDPNASVILRKAYNDHNAVPPTYSPGDEEYENLSTWIEGEIQCRVIQVPIEPEPEPEPDPTPDPEVGGEVPPNDPMMPAEPTDVTEPFCEYLADGDPLGRANGNYLSTYKDTVDRILLNRCGRSGCHGGTANGFQLQSEGRCAQEANFMMTQLYILWSDIDRSPILTRPIDPEHEGYMTFINGSSDQEYILLRNWVISGR